MGRRPGKGKGVLASKRHHLSFLRTVQVKLGVNNMADIRNSQFGHFFEVHSLQFQGQLHTIMCNVLRSSSKERMCLEFEIGNSTVEFGPADFALVSGLNMGGSIETPSESFFYTEILGGSPKVSFDTIKERFIEACKADPDSHLALQWAYLYIVYGVVLMDGRLNAKVPIRFIHLVDDLEKFKAFAWGRVSYEILVKRCHQTKEVIKRLEDGGKERKCEAPGFLDVLQVWAYEICKEMASYCAVKVEPKVGHQARILRWTSDKRSSYDELIGFFLGSSGYEPVPIKATDDEKSMMVRLGVLNSMRLASPVPVSRIPRQKKRKIDNTEEGVAKRSSVRLNRKPGNQSENEYKDIPTFSREAVESVVKNAISEVVKQVGIRFDTFEGKVSKQLEKLENRVDELVEKLGRNCQQCCHPQKEKVASKSHRTVSVESGGGDTDENMKEADDAAHYHGHEETNVDEENGEEEILNEDSFLIRNDIRPAVSNPFCDVRGPLNCKSCVGEAEELVTTMQNEMVGGSATRVNEIPSNVLYLTWYESDPKEKHGCTGHPQSSRESIDGDDTINEANGTAGGESCDKTNEGEEENAVQCTRNNDSVLVRDDELTSSVANPFLGVESPLNLETSLDEVVRLVTTEANDMAGLSSTHPHEIAPNDFDVSELKWDPIKFEPFKKWMGGATKRTRSKTGTDCMRLPGDQLRWAQKSDMCDLMRARGWLDNYHIDALLSIVAYKFDTDFGRRDWGILDMAATNLLLSKNFSAQKMELYVRGQKPTHRGIPWLQVNELFGCANFGENHWVLYQVSLELQQVLVYDSIQNGEECTATYFECLARNIPKLLKGQHVWHEKDTGTSARVPLKEVWEIASCKASPQQPNTFDCGIICMKVLECITRNIPFQRLDPNRGLTYRHSYCAKLWEWHNKYK